MVHVNFKKSSCPLSQFFVIVMSILKYMYLYILRMYVCRVAYFNFHVTRLHVTFRFQEMIMSPVALFVIAMSILK